MLEHIRRGCIPEASLDEQLHAEVCPIQLPNNILSSMRSAEFGLQRT